MVDPGDFHFRLPSSHRRLLWAFTTVSATVIDEVGLDKIRIMNATFLLCAKKDVKKCLYLGGKMTACHAYALMLVQLITTAVDGTTLVLHSV